MITNHEIANILSEISKYLAVQDVPFKPRAFERAAESLESLEQEADEIYKTQGLEGIKQIPGIGEHIGLKIEKILKTGHSFYLEKLKKEIPIKINEIYAVEGVGPKTIAELYKKLGIKNLADLERAAQNKKIRSLANFGQKTEEKILKGIEFLKKTRGRVLLGSILPIAESIEKRLQKIPGVKHATIAGSIRRRQETIGDIDILVTTSHAEQVINTFIKFPEVQHIYAQGSTKALVRLKIGLDADLRVVPENSYGAALQYFTGDKLHNIEIRKIAIKKDYKLSEYGLFKGKKNLAAHTEESIYETLGMEFIPPEIRTASGEIEAAQKRTLPELIPYNSLKGDLQVQTNFTDGTASIEAMAEAAMEAGLEYIAITDHTQALTITHGLDEKGLLKQGRVIDALNKKFESTQRRFHIFKSAEVNILKDGKLDIADSALKQLDLVGVSVHSNFKISSDEMTKRIIQALKNPYVNILFHPTGRLINKREPYAVDILKIIKAAKQYGVAMEINAFPERLDLKDTHIRLALKEGVKFVINSDAHSIHHFGVLNLGVAQARRGWSTLRDVLNTQTAQKCLSSLKSLKKV